MAETIKSTSSLKVRNPEFLWDYKDDEKNEKIFTTIDKGVKLTKEAHGAPDLGLKDSESSLLHLTNSETEGFERHYFNFEIPDFSSKYGALEIKKYTTENQRWVGHVTRITNTSFEARLSDITNGGTDELVEFDVSEVDCADRSLLKLGATFYWSIGKITSKDGQTKRESFIRFQRLREWNAKEFDSIADASDEMYKKLIIE